MHWRVWGRDDLTGGLRNAWGPYVGLGVGAGSTPGRWQGLGRRPRVPA